VSPEEIAVVENFAAKLKPLALEKAERTLAQRKARGPIRAAFAGGSASSRDSRSATRNPRRRPNYLLTRLLVDRESR